MSNKSKHIIHLMPYQAVGGTETAALRIASITREFGYKNTFLCLAGCEPVSSFFRDQHFDVVEFPEIEPSFRHISNYWRESKKLAKIFKDLDVDLIHAQDYSAACTCSLAAKMARIKLVSHVRNKHDNISRRDQIFLRLVKHWLFVSNETRDVFSYRASAKKSTVLYDGIKIDEFDQAEKLQNRKSVFEEFGFSKDTKLIGMLARVAPQKDLFTLADAAKKLSEIDNSIKFIIVGDNSKEESTREHFGKISEYIKNSGISGKVIFTGFRNDVGRFIDSFDIHVLSTNFEGFALVNLEVMARKVPAIATLSGSSMEIIEHEKNGLLFEHKNSNDLVKQITKLINDRDFAEKIGAEGFETIKNKFSSERFSADLMNIYKRFFDGY